MSCRVEKLEKLSKAKIPRAQSNGPCLAALNEFAKITDCVSFYDKAYHFTEQFYMKYSIQESKEWLCHKLDNDEIREFQDDDMQLANQCLYRFQTLCDQNVISTRNPISFFDSLSKFVESEPCNYDVALSVFLYAAADKGFLFDCFVVNNMPPQFITRSSIELLKIAFQTQNSSNGSDIVQYIKVPKTEAEQNHALAVLQGQVRDFHLLMAPSRKMFCKTWEECVLPIVRQMRDQRKKYDELFDSNGKTTPPSLEIQDLEQQLTTIVTDCFLWYISTKRHLSVRDRQETERIYPYLSGTGKNGIEQAISELIRQIIQRHNYYSIPYDLYKIITKKCEKLLSAEQIDIGPMLSKGIRLNTTCRNLETTSRKRVRFNLLFFSRLCSRLNKVLPTEAIPYSYHLFELAEPITQDRFPDAGFIDLPPEDSQIAEYIQKGQHGGAAVLPMLNCLLERLPFELQISPFDIFCYKPWDATPQSLSEFLYSAKDRTSRGKQITKKTMIGDHVRALTDFDKLAEQYCAFLFTSPAGYGSGTPTYTWAASIANLVDGIISKSQELSELCKQSTLQREHVELGIHQHFIEWCSARAAHQATVIGKKLLYNSSIRETIIGDPVDVSM